MTAHRFRRRLSAACLLLALGTSLSGCIVAPGGPGWCYYHPWRCR